MSETGPKQFVSNCEHEHCCECNKGHGQRFCCEHDKGRSDEQNCLHCPEVVQPGSQMCPQHHADYEEEMAALKANLERRHALDRRGVVHWVVTPDGVAVGLSASRGLVHLQVRFQENEETISVALDHFQAEHVAIALLKRARDAECYLAGDEAALRARVKKGLAAVSSREGST